MSINKFPLNARQANSSSKENTENIVSSVWGQLDNILYLILSSTFLPAKTFVPSSSPSQVNFFLMHPPALALSVMVPLFCVSTHEDRPADLGLKVGFHHLPFSYLPCVLSTDKNVNPNVYKLMLWLHLKQLTFC